MTISDNVNGDNANEPKKRLRGSGGNEHARMNGVRHTSKHIESSSHHKSEIAGTIFELSVAHKQGEGRKARGAG